MFKKLLLIRISFWPKTFVIFVANGVIFEIVHSLKMSLNAFLILVYFKYANCDIVCKPTQCSFLRNIFIEIRIQYFMASLNLKIVN